MKALATWLKERWNSLLTAAALNCLLLFLLTTIPHGWMAFSLLLTTFLLRGRLPGLIEVIVGGLQVLVVGAGIVINYVSGRISLDSAVVIALTALVILVIRVVPVVLLILNPARHEK
ncbi:MAG: hypothetical protein ACK5DD_04940 [Cyclobacteriaceae bacterium]|jgi:hypothetical protein